MHYDHTSKTITNGFGLGVTVMAPGVRTTTISERGDMLTNSVLESERIKEEAKAL